MLLTDELRKHELKAPSVSRFDGVKRLTMKHAVNFSSLTLGFMVKKYNKEIIWMKQIHNQLLIPNFLRLTRV